MYMKRVLLPFLLLNIVFGMNATDKNYHFLVGTYTTNTPSKGIYELILNPETLESNTKLLAETIDPSFLCFDAKSKNLYCVSERGAKSSVISYRFTADNSLQLLNKVDAGTVSDPCHIAYSAKHVVTANYSSGNIFVFKREFDSSLSNIIQTLQHSGSSVHPTRQTKPHTHQVTFSPDKKYLLATDLGIDKIMVYTYNPENEEQPFTLFSSFDVKAGSGPRHLCFDKSGRKLFLIQELDGTVSALKIEKGNISLLDTNTVARTENIQNGAADIHISPNGKFVYATNRGNVNNISCFEILKSGKLRFVEQISAEGEGPRNFAITHDGKTVLIGNQRSNSISIFICNPKTGKLTFAQKKILLGAPVCITEF